MKQRPPWEEREARRHGTAGSRGSEEASAGDGRKLRSAREGEGCEEYASKVRHAGADRVRRGTTGAQPVT